MHTQTVKNKGNEQIKPKGARKPLLFKTRLKTGYTADEQEILQAANQAREEWIDTINNFDYVCEDMLVDYYIYKLKACESRYTYFVKLVKEKGLTNSINCAAGSGGA